MTRFDQQNSRPPWPFASIVTSPNWGSAKAMIRLRPRLDSLGAKTGRADLVSQQKAPQFQMGGLWLKWLSPVDRIQSPKFEFFGRTIY